MDDKQNIQDLLASYALGSLDQEEVNQVEALLAKSHSARDEVIQYQQVADLIGLSAAAIEPSAGFEDRLFARIKNSPAESGVESKVQPPAVPRPHRPESTPPPFFERLSGFFAQPVWQLAGGLALVFMLFTSSYLMFQNRQMQNELDLAVNNSGLPTFELASVRGIESNTGLIVMSLDGVNGTAIIDGMELPAADSQYQLWLIEDGEIEAGPTFELNEVGYGARWVRSAKPLSSYDHFMITLEPAGGSLIPTGATVLEWMAIHEENR